jgi:hypothetical protein
MFWLFKLAIVLTTHAHDGQEATDRLLPAGVSGNPWGPVATRARETGEMPALVITPKMTEWDLWGRGVLREGDIVFRLGNAKTLVGLFPFSWFLAKASRSQYSHTGIVAIEDGAPVVYDCTSCGVRRQPFHVWTLDNVGTIGVKRLRADWRKHIGGVIDFCRKVYEDQVPFDYEFSLDDSKLYCLEMTEKAFRSQGLQLSESVRLGDMESLDQFPLSAFMFVHCSALSLAHPISLEQSVYLPGNAQHGIWSSPMLETIYPPEAANTNDVQPRPGNGLSFQGDFTIILGMLSELGRN